jgi:hypothetical protein
MDTALEPCRRSSGSFRAYFNTQADAEAFEADPRNVDYHGDIAHHCHKCLRWPESPELAFSAVHRRAAYEERELMSDRREFLKDALKSAACLAAAKDAERKRREEDGRRST